MWCWRRINPSERHWISRRRFCSRGFCGSRRNGNSDEAGQADGNGYEQEEQMRRYLYFGGGLLMLGLVFGAGQFVFERPAAAQGSKPQSPIFQVDPMWPKPLPN